MLNVGLARQQVELAQVSFASLVSRLCLSSSAGEHFGVRANKAKPGA